MGHAIEIFETGQAAFVDARYPAWHGLGTVFAKELAARGEAERALTTQEALDLAHLSNWNVTVEPLKAELDGRIVSVPNRFLVTRDHPVEVAEDGSRVRDPLAVVGSRYVPLTNEQAFAWTQDLIGASGAMWETAGSLYEGRVTFGSLLLPNSFVLDPAGANDEVVFYLVIRNSFDGSSPVVATETPVRVVCANTLAMAMHGAKMSWSIKHTKSVEERFEAVKQTMARIKAYNEQFEGLARRLYAKPMDRAAFHTVLLSLYPKPKDTKKGATPQRWQNKIDLIDGLMWGGLDEAEHRNANIEGTAWAGLNAVFEYLDWFRKGRGKAGLLNIRQAAAGFDLATTKEKERVRKAFATFADS